MTSSCGRIQQRQCQSSGSLPPSPQSSFTPKIFPPSAEMPSRTFQMPLNALSDPWLPPSLVIPLTSSSSQLLNSAGLRLYSPRHCRNYFFIKRERVPGGSCRTEDPVASIRDFRILPNWSNGLMPKTISQMPQNEH